MHTLRRVVLGAWRSIWLRLVMLVGGQEMGFLSLARHSSAPSSNTQFCYTIYEITGATTLCYTRTLHSPLLPHVIANVGRGRSLLNEQRLRFQDMLRLGMINFSDHLQHHTSTVTDFPKSSMI